MELTLAQHLQNCIDIWNNCPPWATQMASMVQGKVQPETLIGIDENCRIYRAQLQGAIAVAGALQTYARGQLPGHPNMNMTAILTPILNAATAVQTEVQGRVGDWRFTRGGDGRLTYDTTMPPLTTLSTLLNQLATAATVA